LRFPWNFSFPAPTTRLDKLAEKSYIISNSRQAIVFVEIVNLWMTRSMTATFLLRFSYDREKSGGDCWVLDVLTCWSSSFCNLSAGSFMSMERLSWITPWQGFLWDLARYYWFLFNLPTRYIVFPKNFRNYCTFKLTGILISVQVFAVYSTKNLVFHGRNNIKNRRIYVKSRKYCRKMYSTFFLITFE